MTETEAEHQIALTVVSASGDLTDEFATGQTIGALKESVMDRLGVDPSSAEEFKLVFDDDPLDEGRTLEEVDLPDEAKVILEPEPEVI